MTTLLEALKAAEDALEHYDTGKDKLVEKALTIIRKAREGGQITDEKPDISKINVDTVSRLGHI